MPKVPKRRIWLGWFAMMLLSLGARLAVAQTIRLSVDLSEAPRRIFHARLVIPASPGPITLLYPKWIPGEHGPTGPIVNLAGMKFTAAGKTLPWRRDDVDMYAFHLDVPAGARELEAELDYLSPSQGGFTAGAAATAQLAVLSWNYLLLYPQGKGPSELTYTASVRLPEGWKFGTALPVAKQSAETIEFAPVSLMTLVDSPVLAGGHYRTVPLSVSGLPPHEIDMASDSESALEMSPQRIAGYTQLVAEANALFGAAHYRSYRFLLTLSDHVSHFGLEHHESSDNRLPARSFPNDAQRRRGADLLPHEFVHSWNGKYRRPAGLATGDFTQPMKGDLLWGYEGLTQYLGKVLTARSGLYTPEDFREDLANIAASLDRSRPGRAWRPLADTAIAAQILYDAPGEWESWRRGTDFYDESVLIWLEVETMIRQQSQGRRTLDDFCRLFHGGQSGLPEVKPYTVDSLVAALNEIAPYDWKGFFATRLNSTEPRAPLGGLEASGWKLVFTEAPNELGAANERERSGFSLRYSLGLRIRAENGTITDAVPGMAAAQAGLAPGMKLIAVNGQQWSPELLREALRAAKASRQPMELMVENAGFYKSYSLAYYDGEKYPHLERDSSRPDLLGEIIKARAPRTAGTP